MLSSVLRRSVTVSGRRCPGVVVGSESLLNTRFFSGKDAKDSDKDAKEDKSETSFVDQREIDRVIRDNLPVTFADISRAHVAIRDGVVRTKCEKSVFSLGNDRSKYLPQT